MVSLLNERSPLTRNEAGTIVCGSTCLVSQTISARGSAELDRGRSLERRSPGFGIETAAEPHLGEAGSAQVERIDMPGVSVGSQFTAHALDRAAGKGKPPRR